MIIEKKQKDLNRCVFNWSYFHSARDGLYRTLQDEELKGKKILLPAYIGYSSREGSGVFDPIRNTKMKYLFYNLDTGLNINLKGLKGKINDNQNNILLIIHYFGFKDKYLEEIKEYAKQRHMIIVEDFAQAFFTFWLNPVIDFDYAIFSIHKLFPEDSGGMVLGKKEIKHSINGNSRYDLFRYNIKEIIQRRIENYKYILDKFKKQASLYRITVLKDKLSRTVPQTFPILLHDRGIRDYLYFQMNREGYGVVSLYHTLIDKIDASFRVEHGISSRILNLPVHQDAEREDLGRMMERMLAIIKNYKKETRRERK